MAFTEGITAGYTSGATTVSLVSPPASGKRIIKSINIYNRDTVNATVTVQYYDGTQAYPIYKINWILFCVTADPASYPDTLNTLWILSGLFALLVNV